MNLLKLKALKFTNIQFLNEQLQSLKVRWNLKNISYLVQIIILGIIQKIKKQTGLQSVNPNQFYRFMLIEIKNYKTKKDKRKMIKFELWQSGYQKHIVKKYY